MPLLFDGDCRFCTAAVAWMRRRFDPAAESVAWQEADLAALGVTVEEAEQAVQWAEGGERASGADAIASWLRTARRLRPVVRLFPVGLPLGRLLYPVVARNRSRISTMVPR
jgi:predicted DCC family thiol-disulfide oxidoreductase YuxK